MNIEKSRDAASLMKNIKLNIDNHILPQLEVLKRLYPKGTKLINGIEKALNTLYMDYYTPLLKENYGLTPMEIRISALIMQSFTEKEIAEVLNISILTVKKHKQNIRKKFSIYNKPIGLKNFLNKL